MTLNGELLRSLTVPNLPAYEIRAVDNSLIGLKSWDFLEPLLDNKLVCGVGSKNRVKKYHLLVEMAEADRILGENASKTRRERAQLPLDVLHRMCADRKTTKRVSETVVRGGRTVHATWFEHKTAHRVRFRGEAA